MKRTILSCLMAVGIWLTAMATNTVTLTSVQGHPGDEVEVQAMLTNEAAVTALEIQIPLCDALSYVDGSATLNADRSNGHVLSAAVVDGNLRIYIYSTSLTAIKDAEGLLCSFKLKLGKKPAVYSLIPKVILSDATGKAVESAGRSATVTLLAPQIEVATPQIDFGHIPIRSSYTQSLYIRNTGTEPLTISHIDLGCAELKASPTTCTIAAGITQEFVLTYSPVQWGAMETEVTITSDAINPKAGKAEVKADPYSVNELHVQRAEGVSDSEVTVTLKMNNMEPIAAAQCSFALPEGLVYVEGSAAVGSRCNGSNHTATGSVAGNRLTLYLYSMNNSALPEGDGELMTFRLSLKGQSGYYRLNPENVILGSKALINMTSAVSSEYVVIQSPIFSGAEEVKFVQTPITQKAKANYTVHNTGSENLVVSKVTFLAEGYGVEEVLPLTVPPKASRDLTVCYSPTTKGQYGTTMNVYTNDPNNRMAAVRLQGEVYEPNNITVCYTQEANGAYAYHFGMDNYTDIVAVQFDLRCPDGMAAVANGAKVTERLKNHSFNVVDMGNGVYRVLIYSFGNKAIEGHSGLLLTVPFTVAEGVDATSVEAENIVLSNREGNNSASYIGEWVDVTNKIVNADFSSRSNGWSGTAFTAANGYIAEQWNKTFDNYQVLKGMEAGRYKLTCQGYYRYGSIDHAKTNFKKGTEKMNAVLYMNEAQKPFVSIFSEDYYTLDPYNYPDNVTQANTAFNTYGRYTGNVVEYNLKRNGDLKIGMKKEVAVDEDWVIFDNFRLYYMNVIATPVIYKVADVQLSEKDVTMEIGESIELIATVLPDNATDKNVVWSSSDESIAVVENGIVKAMTEGTAIITARVGDKSTTCVVKVIRSKEYQEMLEKLNGATPTQPKDATPFIVNPSFDGGKYGCDNGTGNGNLYSPEGWQVTYTKADWGWKNFQPVKDGKGQDGAQYFEFWGATYHALDMSQEVYLPAGTYVLSAAMRTERADQVTNQHIYMKVGDEEFVSPVLGAPIGDYWNAVNAWQTLTVTLNLNADGWVTIGAESSGGANSAGWFQIDNFRLSYLGTVNMGDVNGDGNVNIADAIGVVNYVLKNEMTTFVAEAADMNGDGSINIADAIAIVNQILKM